MVAARLAVLIVGLALVGTACAQAAASGTDWRSLSPAQREVLAPLAGDWAEMGDAGRRQWIGIADRFGGLTPEEQQRIRMRMKDWADLTPEERERARDQYRALRNVPPEQREALREQWQQYRNLPPEERQVRKDTRGARGGTNPPARD